MKLGAFDSFEEILEQLEPLRNELLQFRETILANLVMLGEIASPTFSEQDRVLFLMQRFCECGLQNTSSDEVGNGVGIIPGRDKDSNILLVAHADTVFDSKTDHTITLHEQEAVGPGVADNSLGLALLASLPTILERLDISLQSNLVLMGAVRELGRGNLEGLGFFLENNRMPFRAGLCVEGAQLGRLSYGSAGMLRGEIVCRVPEEFDWVRRGSGGAIVILNEVINRLLAIPLPRRPRTSVVLGSTESGAGYNLLPLDGMLRFEVRSESDEEVRAIREKIEDLVAEVVSVTGAEIEFRVVATREAGGIGIGHPLVRASRRIMENLDITPAIAPSISELSMLIRHGIPAVTLGMTRADGLHTLRESVRVDTMFTGIAQFVGLLLAIDGGFCDEAE